MADAETSVDSLQRNFSKGLELEITSQTHDDPIIVCDMGYGLPKEARPRKEKILAVSRQLVNYLLLDKAAKVTVVECPDVNAIMTRVSDLWKKEAANKTRELTESLEVTDESLTEWLDKHSFVKNECRYLSPDAEKVLSKIPKVTIVGLIIDRKSIQVNRSLNRANELDIPACSLDLSSSNLSSMQEPLNVDCVLDALHGWRSKDWSTALNEALRRHQERHPKRPQHVEK